MYVTNPTDLTQTAPIATLANGKGNTHETQLKAGKNLYLENDEANWLYQVKSGVLRLTRLLEDGRRQVIAFGYPGDIVGFSSNGLHHTDCDAVVAARLQPYRRSLVESGKCDPKLQQEFFQAAMREISAMQDHFMMLGRKSADEKIASFLCTLTDRIGKSLGAYSQVELQMRRADIADFLGLTTETVSRTLTQLRKKKIIAIENIHTIIILRPSTLLDLSLGECKLRSLA